MLEELTAKQDALLENVYEEYVDSLTLPTKIVMADVKAWLTIAYGLYDMKCPERIEIVDSPFAALKLATELTGERQTDTDWCGLSDSGWIAFYDYFRRIKVLTEEEAAEMMTLSRFGKMTWDTVLLDECAIVIKRPKSIHVDADGNLHSPTEAPCIEWHDGEVDYAHHGNWVPERIVMDPCSYSAAEYKAITNTEERRALGERAGWAHIASLLGANSIDKWTDPETGLAYDLMRCEDGTQLLSKQSPPLANKLQPLYFEPVNRELRTAQAARKWQATDMTPAQCEADPVLTYDVEA